MKLLYLYVGDFTNQMNGVNLKINSQNEKLNLYTEHCHLVAFSEKVDKLTTINNHTFIYPIRGIGNGKYFHTYKKRKAIFDSIIEFLDSHAKNYDKIFMRYPYYSDKHCYKLFKKYRMAVEHNDIEESVLLLEIKDIYRGIPFSFKPGFFIDVLDRVILPYVSEKWYSKHILKKISFGACVTNEIAEYEKKKCPGYKTLVITNGIDISKTSLRNKQKTDKIIRCFLLAGYTAHWHGIERILSGINTYKTPEDFEIHLIGRIAPKHLKVIEENKLKNVFVHATKSRDEIQSFVKDFDFSFGSLALYVVKLNEATVLKVRSDLAAGFPIVKAYFDTDIDSSEELKKYSLTFPNNTTPLDFYKIKEFIDKVNLDAEHPFKIRQLASPLIDMDAKMKLLAHEIEHSS